MNVPLIQYPYQLSEAACDPLLANLISLKKRVNLWEWGNRLDPQDWGIETFANDTLERYPPTKIEPEME